MSTSVPESILSAALGLSPDARAELADKLLVSLGPPTDPAISAAWAKEVEARIDAHDRGETVSLPGDQVLNELRNRWND